MKLDWDEGKRRKTFEARGLDFARCEEVFAGPKFEYLDIRKDYGEDRWITVGLLEMSMVFVVWTERGEITWIISMRHATPDERETYGKQLY
jgi:uncharacterized DUF497 family protein